jgi:hypothetical protein
VLASDFKVLVIGILRGLITGVFHPNVLLVSAFAAAVYAAYRTWGVNGSLWAFAILATLLALANAGSTKA